MTKNAPIRYRMVVRQNDRFEARMLFSENSGGMVRMVIKMLVKVVVKNAVGMVLGEDGIDDEGENGDEHCCQDGGKTE